MQCELAEINNVILKLILKVTSNKSVQINNFRLFATKQVDVNKYLKQQLKRRLGNCHTTIDKNCHIVINKNKYLKQIKICPATSRCRY